MFSIIIPVHNKLPHLDRTVGSVLKQTFQEFEIILIDDASTDGSSTKVNEYTDSRIKVLRRETPGPGGYAARNLGISNSKFDWVAFLDADDEWDENYLLEISKCIELHRDVKMVTTEWIKTNGVVNNKSNALQSPSEYKEFDLIDYLKNPKFVWTGALVVNKSLILKNGGFPTNKLCKRGGDVDTWIRWLDVGGQNILIKKVLSYYHQGTVNQVTGKPNTYFCAYDTLKLISENNINNQSLVKAIKHFNNKFIYNMLVRQVKSGMPIDFEYILKMNMDLPSVLRIGKLSFLRIKYLFRRGI